MALTISRIFGFLDSQKFYSLQIDRSRSYPHSHARPARSRTCPCSRMCHFILNFRLIICPLHLHPSRSYPRSHARPARSRSLATLAPSSFSFSILCSSIPLVRSLARMLALFALIRSSSSLLLICHLLSLVAPYTSARPARSSSLAPLAPALHYTSPSSS